MAAPDCTGKVALVTGGASGIGRAVVKAFAAAGAKVVVSDLNADSGTALAAELRQAGGDAMFVRADVTRRADVAHLVERSLAAYGRLDMARNNVGGGSPNPSLTDLAEAEWDRTFELCLKGAPGPAEPAVPRGDLNRPAKPDRLKSTWLCMKFEIPAMLRQGHLARPFTLTPTLSRKRAREQKAGSLSPVPGGECWGEGATRDAANHGGQSGQEKRMSMKFGPIFHVGYAVPDMDKALAYWTGVMGVGPFFLERHVTGQDEEYTYKGQRCVQDVTVAHAYTGDMDIELICPNLIAPSPVCDYLARHPEGGVQHLGVLIDDWDATLARPEVQPHLVLQGHAGNIRIAFCDGFAMGGTALEFIEASDEIRSKFSRLKSFCNAWDGKEPIRGKIGAAHSG